MLVSREVTPALSRAHLAREKLLHGCDSNEWTSSAESLAGNAPDHSKYQAVKPRCKSLDFLLLKSLKIPSVNELVEVKGEEKATLPFSLQWGSSGSLEAPKASRKKIIFCIFLNLTQTWSFKRCLVQNPQSLYVTTGWNSERWATQHLLCL